MTTMIAALYALPLLFAPQEANASSEPLQAPTVEETIVSQVETVLDAAMQEEGVVGLSVAVGLGEEVIFSRGYGIAELEHGVPVNAQTMFRIGSVTKQFTGAAIMRLAEEAVLFVDDELSSFVPQFDTQGVPVTLRHLLTHTSGVPSYTDLGEEWFRVTPLELSHAELLALQDGLPLEFEPGARFRYSNTGYYLLGMVIEEASGVGYAEYLEREFFERLGLKRTRYGSNGDLIPNRAQGYRYLGEGRFANDLPLGMSQPYAAGSLLSTGEDLVRWTIALTKGRVVSPEGYEEMTMPYLLLEGGESLYGFGLDLHDQEGRPSVSHGGGIFGFNSILLHFPEDDLTIAVISNSEAYNSGALGMRLARAIGELE